MTAVHVHEITLEGYRAKAARLPLYLGTAGSHGKEQLHVTLGEGWQDFTTVHVIFHPCAVDVQLPDGGALDVPWEATAKALTMAQGRIVFQGFDDEQLVNSLDVPYIVDAHSPAVGRDEQPYTPGMVEGVLNQMRKDKADIEAAALAAETAKSDAAKSADAAAGSATTAQSAQTSAASSAKTATDKANAAQKSADAAAGSETAAAGSAKAAATSAKKAAGSAQTAGEQASAAQTSAGQAAQSATAAAESAALAGQAAAQGGWMVLDDPDQSGHLWLTMSENMTGVTLRDNGAGRLEVVYGG